MGRQRREAPIRRVNPSGKVVWVAKPRDTDGNRFNRGTYARKGPCSERERDDCCAQHAIDAFYEEMLVKRVDRGTVRAFAADWTARFPRSERTNRSSDMRLKHIIEAPVDGRPFGDWPFAEVRRRHALELIDFMLREQGRATTGAMNIIRTLSSMAEDAITDEVIEINPFRGVKVRTNDPRATKASRKATVLTWEQMHAFAAAAARVETVSRPTGYRWSTYGTLNQWRQVYAESMLRTLSDCGLRLGELLVMRRELQDLGGGTFTVKGTAWEGEVLGGTREKNHSRSGPIPPGCLSLLQAMPPRIDSEWLFPTVTGALWRESNFYRDIWRPTRDTTGLACTPHDFRHSYVTALRAAGVDPADLADVTGHSVETATTHYTHPLRRSDDAIRAVIG